MRRLIITGPEELVQQFADLEWIECFGNSDVFDVPDEEFDRAISKGEILGLTIEEKVTDKIFIRCGPAVHCFCGMPLHYPEPEAHKHVVNCCRTLGELVNVNGFAVPRHYIALHGLKGNEPKELGFERWTTKATN